MIGAADLRAGQHLAVLGADAHGKAEVELEALERCRALLRRVGAGLGGRRARRPRSAPACSTATEVTEIGAVLLGARPVAQAADEITLFDSTGLAIQDLGIAAGVLAAWREGSVDAPTIAL